jgi:hypothetical protein
MGSSIDDFLRRQNIFEEAQAQAIKEIVAWQLTKAMRKKKISSETRHYRCRVCSGQRLWLGSGW